MSDPVARRPMRAGCTSSSAWPLGTSRWGRYDVASTRRPALLTFVLRAGYHLLGLRHMDVEEHGAARKLRACAARGADGDFNNSYGWFLCSGPQEPVSSAWRSGATLFSTATRRVRSPTRACASSARTDDRGCRAQFCGRRARPGERQAVLSLADIARRSAALERAPAVGSASGPGAPDLRGFRGLGLRTERQVAMPTPEALRRTFAQPLRRIGGVSMNQGSSVSSMQSDALARRRIQGLASGPPARCMRARRAAGVGTR